MRILIVATFIACATAAPTVIGPLGYQTAVVPAVVATISPGDIQGAVSEVQAKINDQVQDITDQARAVANANSQINDLINEKNVEAFWSNEDQKWQAVDAVKSAEAAIDGDVASNAPEYAKAAVAGVAPYVAVSPVAPLVPAINPFASIIIPSIKTVPTVEVKAEENKEVKTAETETKVDVTGKPVAGTVLIANPVVTPYSGVYGYGLSVPHLNNLVSQPVLNYRIQTVPNVLAPRYYW